MIYLDTAALVKLIRREPESDAGYTSPDLRSPDAIHLATAHAVFSGQLSSFVSYDKRLLGAAQALRLPVASPGV